MKFKLQAVAALFALPLALTALAQQSITDKDAKDATIQEIERYREMLADGNPAELYEVKGEELWKTKRGPKNVSLEKCDLGLGAGVVKGAYAQMPRYFADVDKVQDAGIAPAHLHGRDAGLQGGGIHQEALRQRGPQARISKP